MSAISCNFPVYNLEATNEPPDSIAFLTNFELRKHLNRFQGPLQATALDQDVFDAWVYNPQSNKNPCIPDATKTKHPFWKKRTK